MIDLDTVSEESKEIFMERWGALPEVAIPWEDFKPLLRVGWGSSEGNSALLRAFMETAPRATLAQVFRHVALHPEMFLRLAIEHLKTQPPSRALFDLRRLELEIEAPKWR